MTHNYDVMEDGQRLDGSRYILLSGIMLLKLSAKSSPYNHKLKPRDSFW